MKKEIKTGDKTWEINFPELIDESTRKVMEDWVKLHEEHKKPKKDEWSEIPMLPGYRFLNLELKEGPLEVKDDIEIDINISYDRVEKID